MQQITDRPTSSRIDLLDCANFCFKGFGMAKTFRSSAQAFSAWEIATSFVQIARLNWLLDRSYADCCRRLAD